MCDRGSTKQVPSGRRAGRAGKFGILSRRRRGAQQTALPASAVVAQSCGHPIRIVDLMAACSCWQGPWWCPGSLGRSREPLDWVVVATFAGEHQRQCGYEADPRTSPTCWPIPAELGRWRAGRDRSRRQGYGSGSGQAERGSGTIVRACGCFREQRATGPGKGGRAG